MGGWGWKQGRKWPPCTWFILKYFSGGLLAQHVNLQGLFNCDAATFCRRLAQGVRCFSPVTIACPLAQCHVLTSDPTDQSCRKASPALPLRPCHQPPIGTSTPTDTTQAALPCWWLKVCANPTKNSYSAIRDLKVL